MKVVRFRWNGGIELDPKSVIFILTLAFAIGGGWAKLSAIQTANAVHFSAIEKKLEDHLATVNKRIVQHDQLLTEVVQLTKRIDACCPLFAPNGKGGAMP